MGRPKQLLPIGRIPMLEMVVRAAEASRLDRVVVVTGFAGVAIRDKVTLVRAVWADNPLPDSGSISSFRVGLAAGGPAAAAMLLPGDQPEISTAIIDDVLGTWVVARPWAMRTRYRGGITAQPFVLSAEALIGLEVETGDKVLWRLMETHVDRVAVVDVDAEAPRDVNTWVDYEAVCARLGVKAASA